LIAAVLLLGSIFSAVAGLMAFVIFYQEYSRHFSERRKARAAAIRGGFAAFFFFMVLMILITLYASTRKIL